MRIALYGSALLLAAAMNGATPPAATADEGPPCRGGDCGVEEEGIYFNLRQTTEIGETYPPGSSASNPSQLYEYVAVIQCPGNVPEHPRRDICAEAQERCAILEPGSPGPYSRIMRRIITSDGSPIGTWQYVAHTCHTPSVPPRSGTVAATLTEAMIVEQFHRTAFALPEMVVQPPDGRTLVNLPVYFQLSWPEAGFEPGEVDTTTIVGHEVRIRPTLAGITYVTGDGASIGPTTSLGGPYPEGDITHTYTSAAAGLGPFIQVEYGGDVSVDGGEWITIPATATVDGPSSSLDVLVSRNRLYDNGG